MSQFESLSVGQVFLALGGVGEGDFTAEHFPVKRREGVGGFRVQHAEKLQFLKVKVANGLHDGKLRHHLGRQQRGAEQVRKKGINTN